VVEAKTEGSLGSRNSVAPTSPRSAMPDALTSVHTHLARRQAQAIVGPHFTQLSEQLAFPASRYTDLFAKMPKLHPHPLTQVAAANQTVVANLAIQGWASNPAFVGDPEPVEVA
jgi:hypothetical protein